MQRFFKTARFTSVDLTDTVFASLPARVDQAADTAVPPLPQADRPERARLMPWRII